MRAGRAPPWGWAMPAAARGTCATSRTAHHCIWGWRRRLGARWERRWRRRDPVREPAGRRRVILELVHIVALHARKEWVARAVHDSRSHTQADMVCVLLAAWPNTKRMQTKTSSSPRRCWWAAPRSTSITSGTQKPPCLQAGAPARWARRACSVHITAPSSRRKYRCAWHAR